jgi:hypothetical protein
MDRSSGDRLLFVDRFTILINRLGMMVDLFDSFFCSSIWPNRLPVYLLDKSGWETSFLITLESLG